jgi:hypothetical protein
MEMADLCRKRLILALEGGIIQKPFEIRSPNGTMGIDRRSMINKEEMRQVEDAQFGNIEKTIRKIKKIQAPYWELM